MLKVWGRSNSINVQKVLWGCVEAGVDFERIDAGGAFGVVGEPWYLEINPNGRVPTIDDDGFILWESNVIVRYLAAKYATPRLSPADPAERALAEQWMDWEHGAVLPPLTPIFWALVRTPPEQRDHEAIERGREASVRVSDILEAPLTGRAYVAGDDFTMADIPVGAALHRWFALDVERPPTPHLEAWYERLRARQGYRTHVALPLT